jgi:hypothetical protein
MNYFFLRVTQSSRFSNQFYKLKKKVQNNKLYIYVISSDEQGTPVPFSSRREQQCIKKIHTSEINKFFLERAF